MANQRVLLEVVLEGTDVDDARLLVETNIRAACEETGLDFGHVKARGSMPAVGEEPPMIAGALAALVHAHLPEAAKLDRTEKQAWILATKVAILHGIIQPGPHPLWGGDD